jgi:hypothetical protein
MTLLQKGVPEYRRLGGRSGTSVGSPILTKYDGRSGAGDHATGFTVSADVTFAS